MENKFENLKASIKDLTALNNHSEAFCLVCAYASEKYHNIYWHGVALEIQRQHNHYGYMPTELGRLKSFVSEYLEQNAKTFKWNDVIELMECL